MSLSPPKYPRYRWESPTQQFAKLDNNETGPGREGGGAFKGTVSRLVGRTLNRYSMVPRTLNSFNVLIEILNYKRSFKKCDFYKSF